MLQVLAPTRKNRQYARRASVLRRLFPPVAYALLGALIGVFVLLAALAFQATRSAVSLDSLRGPIEAALRARLPANADVAIGATALSFDWSQGLILRAREVRLDLPDAATISVEELSTATTLSAILARRFDLGAIESSGINIAVALPRGAGRAVAGGNSTSDGVASLARQLIAADDLIRMAGIESVKARDTAVQVLDGGQAGPALRISEAEWRPLDGGQSRSTFTVAEAGGGTWRLSLDREAEAAGSVLAVSIDGLPLAALAPALAGDRPPYYHSAIAATARLTVDDEGDMMGLAGTISTANGPLSLNDQDRIEDFAATLAFSLSDRADRITIPNGEIRTRTGRIAFEGIADLSQSDGVLLVGSVRGGVLPTASPDRPVELTGGGMVGRIDFSDLAIVVERLQLVTPAGTASAAGQASLGGAAPGISMALSLSEMPIEVARAMWPPFIARKSRQWIDANVKAATVGPATLQVALPPDAFGERSRGRVLPSYALVGSVPFRGAQLTPIPTFPLIEGATGEIAFANATVTVRADSGTIDAGAHGILDASGTTFAIPELGRAEPQGNLHLELSGPVAALATLSNTPPLSVAEDHGIEAETLAGEANLALEARIPLFGGSIDSISPIFRLAVAGFSSTASIEGRTITEADLVLEGSPQAFTVKGEGVFDGMQAAIDMLLGEAGRSDVTLTLDDEARQRLGLGLEWLVQGPIQASIRNSADGAQQIALDLKEARIDLSFLGWEKGSGVPATAHFLMQKNESGTQIRELSISGSGFSAEGELALDPEGMFQRLDFSHVALRPGDDLSATVVAEGAGYTATVSGAALDGRGILRTVTAGLGDSATELGPVRASIDIDAVTGENDVIVSSLTGSLTVADGGLDAASLRGVAGADGSFEWTLSRDAGSRVLRLFADDAGSLIRFTGVYKRIAGGSLILDYSGPVGAAGAGVVLLNDFRLVNETALEPAIQTANRFTDDSSLSRTQVVASGDLNFSQLRVPFSQQDWVVAISDATLRGSMLGATGEGTVNIADGRMAITGTFIPAFGINNIAGSIPVLGLILGGGRDEGLVGITYKLFGPLEDPEMSMNPMSAIAPGIFRKIFEYQ